MSDITMIRHGQASFGKPDYDRLSAIGIRQAQITGRHLADTGRCFDAIYCGRMQRQKQTAEELLKEYRDADLKVPEIVSTPSLDELDAESVWHIQTEQMRVEDPSIEAKLTQVFQNQSE